MGGWGWDINVLDVSVTYLYHVGTGIFIVHIRSTWCRTVLKGGWGGGVGDNNVLDVSVIYLYHVGTFIFDVHVG